MHFWINRIQDQCWILNKMDQILDIYSSVSPHFSTMVIHAVHKNASKRVLFHNKMYYSYRFIKDFGLAMAKASSSFEITTCQSVFFSPKFNTKYTNVFLLALFYDILPNADASFTCLHQKGLNIRSVINICSTNLQRHHYIKLRNTEDKRIKLGFGHSYSLWDLTVPSGKAFDLSPWLRTVRHHPSILLVACQRRYVQVLWSCKKEEIMSMLILMCSFEVDTQLWTASYRQKTQY